MEPSCGWICNPAIVWLDEFAVVKILDRIKNPQDIQGLTLYLAQIIIFIWSFVDNDHCRTLHLRWIDYCGVVFGLSCMFTSRLKEGQGRQSGSQPTGVVFRRGEGYGRMICLIQRRRLVGHGTRVRSLPCFSPAHPVMCAVLQHVFLIMSGDNLHGGCSGKTEKTRDEAIRWLDFRPWTVSKKITVVKNFDRRKYPHVQGLTLYVGVVPGLWLSVIYRIVPFKFHLYCVTLKKNWLWQNVVRAVVMFALPSRATIASHCVQLPRATILFHLSAPKSLILRHVDVHIRFDTTHIYLHSFQLLAPLQRLINTLEVRKFIVDSTSESCWIVKKLPLTNCRSRCCYVCAAAARHFAPL